VSILAIRCTVSSERAFCHLIEVAPVELSMDGFTYAHSRGLSDFLRVPSDSESEKGPGSDKYFFSLVNPAI